MRIDSVVDKVAPGVQDDVAFSSPPSTRHPRRLELTIAALLDIDPTGQPYFVVSTDDGPTSISVPPDLLEWAPTIIDGISIRTLSPLALVHSRAGATATGAFGPPRGAKDPARHGRLVDTFLSNLGPKELEPTIKPMSGARSAP